MPAKLKLAAALLLLSCACSTEVQEPGPSLSAQKLARWAAEREREETESLIRSSLYHACGGDRNLRCQQLAPVIMRGVQPIVPMTDIQCSAAGTGPAKTRNCVFVVGRADSAMVTCSVRFRERMGHHSPYWSDEVFPAESSTSSRRDAVPSVRLGRSSLACTGALLALTDQPEPVDKAPATPPRLLEQPSTLITEEDYPTPAFSQGHQGRVVMKVRVGSHGRIDACTVTRSSGLAYLDQRACELFQARAHFEPARDEQGRDVAAELILDHDWKRPT